jgi:5'-nucleotidase
MKRRSFIQSTSLGALAMGAGLPQKSGELFAQSLTILHTNDLHGRFELLDENGLAKPCSFALRAGEIIRQTKAKEAAVLLLDCGDAVSPDLAEANELRWMETIGYDAFVPGNHDFDRGMVDLARQISQNRVSALLCNYQLGDTPLAGLCRQYRIFQKGSLKIGVFGVGVNPNGLIPKIMRTGLQYLDPLDSANKTARILKMDEQCDLVVCLSHLGYATQGAFSDRQLAATSQHIDLILGGHSHTFLSAPEQVRNTLGRLVWINHAGAGGLLLGKLELKILGRQIVGLDGQNLTVGAYS